MTHRLIVVLSVAILQAACSGEEKDGDTLFEEGRYQEAIEAYSEFLDSNGEDVRVLYNRGRAFQELKDTDNARADFNRIIKKDPSHLEANLSLAQLAYDEEKYEQVLLITARTLKIHDKSAEGYFLTGRARHKLGYAEPALEAYTQAISLDRSMGEAYLYRGGLKVSMNISSGCEDIATARNLKVSGAEDAYRKYCR